MMDPSKLPPGPPPPPVRTIYTDKKHGASLVFRSTREKERYNQQTKLYSPCTCGSGKKYKFCCNGKQTIIIDTGS